MNGRTFLVAIDPEKIRRDIEFEAMRLFHERLIGLVHVLDGSVVEDALGVVCELGDRVVVMLANRAIEVEPPGVTVNDLAAIARDVLDPARRR